MEQWLIRILLEMLLIVSSWLDIRKRQVSVKLLLLFALVGIGVYAYVQPVSLLSLAGGIAIGGILLLVSRLTNGGIGLGDGGLLCVTGIYIGFYGNITLLFSALLLAAVWSVLLIIIKKAGKKTEIPFVPFLLAAYTGMAFL